MVWILSANLQQYQQFGVPWFITAAANGGSAFSYSKGAQVRWDNGTTIERYVSLVDTNTELPSNTSNWSLVRADAAYLGVANVFTQIQTINAAGTPLVINSTNSTGLKTTFKDNGTNRGGIGASSTMAFAAYLSDLATIAGGWDQSGNLIPGAAATYDVGTTSAQWRNVIANRMTVLGNTAPTNGIYLPAANTVGIAAASGLVASFTSTGMNNTVIGATTPLAGTFTLATANAFVPNSSTVPTNGMYLPAANTLGWAVNTTAEMQLTGTALSPATSGGNALGTATLPWANLFLSSGGVIDFGNADVTITHSTDVLAFAGAATRYSFAGGPVVPSTNDGVALGTGALSWSDLFLASGGVINFNNGNATLTHSAGLVTWSVPVSASSFIPSSSTIPTNGLYLPAANTPGIAVNSALGVAFGAGTIGANTSQRHTIPAVAADTIGLLNAAQTFANKNVDSSCTIRGYRPYATIAAGYTLVLADAGTYIDYTGASTGAVTIPPNSSVAFPVGTEIDFFQSGAGQLTFTAGAGVTIQSINSYLKCAARYSGLSAKKVATDTWQLVGNLAA